MGFGGGLNWSAGQSWTSQGRFRDYLVNNTGHVISFTQSLEVQKHQTLLLWKSSGQ